MKRKNVSPAEQPELFSLPPALPHHGREAGNRCIFSPCRTWRYLLIHTWRQDDEPEKPVAWICLNPSTADENQLDPTLRRIRHYSSDWGYNTFYMLNLFGYRATLPNDMLHAADPAGPENDRIILETAVKCDKILCAWGLHGRHLNRQKHVFDMLANTGKLYYLALSKDGIPVHPLYQRQDLQPKPLLSLPD